MKTTLWKAAGMLCLMASAACTDSKKEADELPGSILGEWVLQKSETYLDGELFESYTPVETIDKCVAIFHEDGSYRYYDYPPEEFYDGTYTFDASTGTLTMHSDEVNPAEQICQAQVTAAAMKWTYPADEGGYATVEYYLRR